MTRHTGGGDGPGSERGHEDSYGPGDLDWGEAAHSPGDLWARVIAAAPSDVRELLTNPVAWLSTIIVGWILSLWSSILGYVETVMAEVAAIPENAVARPIVNSFSPIGSLFTSAIDGWAAMTMDVVAGAGYIGPVAWAMMWALPIILLAALWHFLAGFITTYAPIESVPFVGRWFR